MGYTANKKHRKEQILYAFAFKQQVQARYMHSCKLYISNTQVQDLGKILKTTIAT